MSQNHPYMSIEELLSIPRLSAPAVSEDGGLVAWVAAEPNWDDSEYRRHVYVYSAATGEISAVTGGERQGKSPAWSPGGRLAFLSQVGEGDDKADQVFVLAGGRAVQATHVSSGVTAFRWSPRGDGLYCLAPDPGQTEKLKRRRKRYGDLEYVDTDPASHCLFHLDLGSGLARSEAASTCPPDFRPEDGPEDPPQPLAGGKGCHILKFDISPDGRRAVFSAMPLTSTSIPGWTWSSGRSIWPGPGEQWLSPAPGKAQRDGGALS